MILLTLAALLGSFTVAFGLMLLPWTDTAGEAMRESGSSVFTLGFVSTDTPIPTALDVTAGAVGMMFVALTIGYLPSLYSEIRIREALVKQLEVWTGRPSWGPEILARFTLVGGDHGLSNGTHTIDLHHSDSDVGFQIFSLHSLSSFLLMFGLVGLALYSQSKLGVFISIIGAIAAGLGSVWLIGKLFLLTSKLQSSGTIQIDSRSGGEPLGWSWIVEPYRWFCDARALEDVSALAFDGACLRGKFDQDLPLAYEMYRRFVPLIHRSLQATQLQLLDVYGAS